MLLTTMKKEHLFANAYVIETSYSQFNAFYNSFKEETIYIPEVDLESSESAIELDEALYNANIRYEVTIRNRGLWDEYLAYKKAKEMKQYAKRKTCIIVG